MIAGTASIPELVWISVGLVGLIVSVWNLHDAWIDESIVVNSGRNGIYLETARGNVVEEALRVAKSSLIIAAGVAAALAPPALKSQPVTAVSAVITVALFGISTLVVLGSIAARVRRDRVRKAVRTKVS